jgi:nucleotide-binding universal stress UspA family protein
MVERILLAVDESAAARKAVEYVGRVFGHNAQPNAEVTLFHVIENLPGDLVHRQPDAALSQVLTEALRAWSAQAVSRCERQLERYRDLLLAAGIPAAAIRVKYTLDEARPEARRVAAAQAIIKEAAAGGYTTVVVGRRGTSDIPELFLGGVAEKVSRHVVGATVWVVD